jgi:hypothetical protein
MLVLAVGKSGKTTTRTCASFGILISDGYEHSNRSTGSTVVRRRRAAQGVPSWYGVATGRADGDAMMMSGTCLCGAVSHRCFFMRRVVLVVPGRAVGGTGAMQFESLRLAHSCFFIYIVCHISFPFAFPFLPTHICPLTSTGYIA